jgi:hypothetical protein
VAATKPVLVRDLRAAKVQVFETIGSCPRAAQNILDSLLQAAGMENVLFHSALPSFTELLSSSGFEPGQAWDNASLGVRLKRSGIAEYLPGGLSMLPDVTRSMPWLVRQLAFLNQPRSTKAMARHLLYYLDWYLNPEAPRSVFRVLWDRGVRKYLFPAVIPLVSVPLLFSSNLSLAWSALLVFGLLPFYFVTEVIEVFLQGKDMRQRAAALFWYLAATYSDLQNNRTAAVP